MVKDWHPADIVAALRKKGLTQRELSKKNKLSPSAVSVALQKHWPTVEKIIADAIGVPAPKIWPSRYDRDSITIKRGKPKVSRRPRSDGPQAFNRGGRR